jgi:thioredoxin-like negative regulator of GroEL
LKITEWKGKDEFLKMSKTPGTHPFVFAAKWCGFCSRFISEAKSFDSPSNIELFLVDTDNPDESLWDEYSIKIVPTIIVMKEGQPLFRRDGRPMAGLSMADLKQAIEIMSA